MRRYGDQNQPERNWASKSRYAARLFPFGTKKARPAIKAPDGIRHRRPQRPRQRQRKRPGARVAPGPCLVGKGGHFRSPGTRGQIWGKGKSLVNHPNLRIARGTISSGRPDGICRCSSDSSETTAPARRRRPSAPLSQYSVPFPDSSRSSFTVPPVRAESRSPPPEPPRRPYPPARPTGGRASAAAPPARRPACSDCHRSPAA